MYDLREITEFAVPTSGKMCYKYVFGVLPPLGTLLPPGVSVL